MTTDVRYSVYVLISAVTASVGLVLSEIALNFFSITTLQITVLANIVGGIFLIIPTLKSRERPWQNWPISDWLRFAISAVTIYAVGFVLLYTAIDYVGSSKTTMLGRVEAIFVVVLAVLFLGERWSVRHWIATFLALLGAMLISFDPLVFQIEFGWGEILTLLAAFVVSAGIVILKPLVVRRDAQFVTGLGLLMGAVCISPFLDLQNFFSAEIFLVTSSFLLPALIVRGVLLGISWATYNAAMRHIGASRCAVLFLSVSFFTVFFQVVLDAIMPNLGLQVPNNLLFAVAGGLIIVLAVALIQRA